MNTEDVGAVVLRERQSRDRQRWAEMAACFAPDAVIAMSWYSGPASVFVERSRSMDVGGARGVHRLSPPVVRVHGDRAHVELPLVIEFRTDVGGVQADLCSYARSQYRMVLIDDTWRISSIKSVYERDTLTAALPGAVLPVGPEAFAGLRASYRCLAWHLTRSGYPVSHDLLGDDQPKEVARAFDADLDWLTTANTPERTRS